MTATTPSTIAVLEQCSFNAWPARATVLAGDWVMRFSDGYTKRANSLNALRHDAEIDTILPEARALYARHGLPLVVRLSPLAKPETDHDLAKLGFQLVDPSLVMTLPMRRGSGADPRLSHLAVDAATMLDESPTAAWLQGEAEANGVPQRHRAAHQGMLTAIRWPAAFATLSEGGETLAYGMAVAERGFVGLFAIVTRPEVRRRGAARRLTTSLLAWGLDRGASTAYLQVVASNAPAIALYRDLGFGEAYRYHYRVAP